MAQAVQNALDGAVSDVKVKIGTGTAATIVTSNVATLEVAEGTTNGTISVAGSDVAVHGLGSAAYTDSTAYATSTHVHGNITNDGKIGSTADLAVVTTTSGEITTADLTTAAPTTGSATDAVEFITSVSQNSKGKITATKEAVREASTTQSGLLSAADKTKLDALATTYKPLQSAVSDPTVPSSGTTTAVQFIDTISQDANGVITPTKKAIPTVAASTSGEGGKLFEWDWLWGPVRYKARIMQNGQTLREISSASSSDTSNLYNDLAENTNTEVCGFYAYENLGGSSNEVCVAFTTPEKKAIAPGQGSSLSDYQAFADRFGFSLEVTEVPASGDKPAGTVDLILNGHNVAGQEIPRSTSKLYANVYVDK